MPTPKPKPTTPAGYSGTPLHRKLGIGAGMRVSCIGAPKEFTALLGPLPEGVELVSTRAKRTASSRGAQPSSKRRSTRATSGSASPYPIAIVFCVDASSLLDDFLEATRALTEDGGIWIAWPKKTSSIETDITENVLREVLLPTGYVDNKVCAIDSDWSGLRFVKRKELRKPLAAR